MRTGIFTGLIFLLSFAAPSQAQSSWITRYESAIAAYEEADRQNPPPAGAMVLTGSSTMRLWDTVETDLDPLTVIPRGFGGSTIAELDHYLDRIVLAYRPDAVVIYTGDNDVNSGKTPEYIADRFAAVIDRIHAAAPKTRVYVISIKPSIARWTQWAQTQQTNKLLSKLCAGDSRLRYIDVTKALLGPDSQPVAEYFANDRLHLSDAGYEAWAAVVRPALLGADSKPLPPKPVTIR